VSVFTRIGEDIDSIRDRVDVLETTGGGGGAGVFTHVQSLAAATWVIPHTLGRDPVAIQVIVNGSPADEWQTIFTTPGSVVTLGFDLSVSGVARLI
jgi:hypothetical protein